MPPSRDVAQHDTAAPRVERRGSFMSDRQIAQAAINGRRVTFRFLSSQPAHEITGYIVGMDDYHWMVASVVPEAERPNPTDPPVLNALVHKSQVDMIRLWPLSSIGDEPEPVQTLLSQIGGAFWRYCETRYTGR